MEHLLFVWKLDTPGGAQEGKEFIDTHGQGNFTNKDFILMESDGHGLDWKNNVRDIFSLFLNQWIHTDDWIVFFFDSRTYIETF